MRRSDGRRSTKDEKKTKDSKHPTAPTALSTAEEEAIVVSWWSTNKRGERVGKESKRTAEGGCMYVSNGSGSAMC